MVTAAIVIVIMSKGILNRPIRPKIKVNNKENIDLNNSIENTHETVGYAVMTTSLTIAFGFSVLGLSNFIPTILFGLFTALAMIIAMFGVLITLPSSLIRFKL